MMRAMARRRPERRSSRSSSRSARSAPCSHVLARPGGASLRRSLAHAASARLRGRRRARRRAPARPWPRFHRPRHNLEGALGITDSVELGLRTGIRLGDDGKLVGADAFGRTLFTETYGTGNDAVANPEFRVRWAAYSGRVVEVGLDGRLYLPIEDEHARRPHVRCSARLPHRRLPPDRHRALSPRRLHDPGVDRHQRARLLLVPGLEQGLARSDDRPAARRSRWSRQLARRSARWASASATRSRSAVDLKWMLFAPRVNADRDEPRVFGAGFGVQFRIGE